MQTSKRKGSPDISSTLVGKKQRLSTALDEDQDISEFLQSSIVKRDIKSGTKVIKNAQGKAKLAKGEVGGGSFQSMGEIALFCPAHVISLISVQRSSPFTLAFADSPGIPNTYPNPTTFNACSSKQSSKRPRRHGTYWIREIFGIYGSPCPKAWCPSLDHIRCQGFDLTSHSRVGPPSHESGQGISQRLLKRSRRACRRQDPGRFQ